MRTHFIEIKNLQLAQMVVYVLKGHTSQAAEKLVRAVGRGFIPGIKSMESAVALATEECFSDFLLGNKPFSAACSVVP
jgi:hypothetical protein